MKTATGRLIAPPEKPYSRCSSWSLFERRFKPLIHRDSCVLWEVGTLPKPRDPREWWTLLDCDGKLIVAAGFRFVNRLGFIRCRNLWDGEAHQHPEYRYDLC